MQLSKWNEYDFFTLISNQIIATVQEIVEEKSLERRDTSCTCLIFQLPELSERFNYLVQSERLSKQQTQNLRQLMYLSPEVIATVIAVAQEKLLEQWVQEVNDTPEFWKAYLGPTKDKLLQSLMNELEWISVWFSLPPEVSQPEVLSEQLLKIAQRTRAQLLKQTTINFKDGISSSDESKSKPTLEANPL